MKTTLIPLFIFLSGFISIHAQEETPEKKAFNVLSIPNGAYVLKAPPTFNTETQSANKISKWSKEAIIDGSNEKGWGSAEESSFPFEFIFELSEEC
jgi:hypothetical protein